MDTAGRSSDPAYHLVRRFPRGSVLVALTLVYVLGVSSVAFSPEGSKVAVWWPAAGVSLAMLVLAPGRWRWRLTLAIVLVSALANYSAGRTPLVSLGFGVSNAAEVYVVTWLLTRGRPGRARLRTLEDLWRLVLATLAGTLVVGFGIGLTASVGLDGPFWWTAVAVMASHAAAILVFAPLALDVGPSTLRGRATEALVQGGLLLIAVGYIFSPGQVLSLTFLPLPLMLWASLRFGLRMVSYELIMIGLVTTTLTVLGGGPFALGARTGVTTPATTASLVQAFLIVTALISLPLAVAVEQRRTALVRMSQSEELFRKTFSESFVGMLLLYLSPHGLRIRELNQTAAEILGADSAALADELFSPLLRSFTSIDEVAQQMVTGEITGWREEMWLAGTGHRRIGLALSPLSTSAEEAMFSAQIVDVTEAYDATTRLRSEKDFTGAVLNTTACLIVVVDVEGRLAGLNPAVVRASGHAEGVVLGQPLWGTLVAQGDEAVMRDLLDRTRPDGETPTFEGDLLTTTGRRRRVVWTSAPLTDDQGQRTHVVLTGIDVTEERNVRSMTNHLLDSATATVFIGMSLRGVITIFNAGAQDLLGRAGGDVVSQVRFEELLDPAEIAERAREVSVSPGFEALVADVETHPHTRDWTCRRPDGSTVTCSMTVSAVRDAFGTHMGYLAVGRDVTEARRNQRLLVETLEKEREAVERLKDLDRAKNDFVSMVSHELRTQITSIVGYTEMLQDGAAGAVSRDQDRLLDAVRRNGERLIALIEDLLTLSRIESGTFALERRSLDLRTILTRSHETLGPMLSGRQLDVRFDVPPEPVPVLGDPGQLERVVMNLVGNAVKFTEDGGSVECRLGTQDGHARIEVSDTGIGIPDDEQPAMFTRFFRSRAAQDRAIQGTGLGLPIVQSIVHSHGGTIGIRSEYLVGTDVHVLIPLTRARSAVPVPE